MIESRSLSHPAVWTARELAGAPEWQHALEPAEQAELLALADGWKESPVERGGPGPEDLPLPLLSRRLHRIRDQLEEGAGLVRLRGFPRQALSEPSASALYWALCVHLGTPVTQSADGKKIFAVQDAGHPEGDPRARGPNTSKPLRFHTDRSDVVGFLCVVQASSGGDNEVASSMAIYNRILAERPDLLEILKQPFHYQRHSVDPGNPRPWCRQPIFSFARGHFACCLLRVLIERAHQNPELPDLGRLQIEALDRVEEIAAEPAMSLRFRQQPGDILFLNNWVVLHRRTRFVDHPARRRRILRAWLSMPNSRPLDAHFLDNYGSVEAGAVRGGMRVAPER